MIATVRQPAAPPPRLFTKSTVTVWIRRLVPNANIKRIEPIWTRSPPFFVIRAVNAE